MYSWHKANETGGEAFESEIYKVYSEINISVEGFLLPRHRRSRKMNFLGFQHTHFSMQLTQFPCIVFHKSKRSNLMLLVADAIECLWGKPCFLLMLRKPGFWEYFFSIHIRLKCWSRVIVSQFSRSKCSFRIQYFMS